MSQTNSIEILVKTDRPVELVDYNFLDVSFLPYNGLLVKINHGKTKRLPTTVTAHLPVTTNSAEKERPKESKTEEMSELSVILRHHITEEVTYRSVKKPKMKNNSKNAYTLNVHSTLYLFCVSVSSQHRSRTQRWK